MKEKLKGLVPVMLTPLNQQGHPDVEGIHKLINFHATVGSSGLWVLGSAGEDIHLSWEDRVIVAQETIKANDNRLQLFIGVGQASFYEIMSFCEAIEYSKIRAIHFLPYDIKMGRSQLISYCIKVADALPCPLWLYHNPKRGNVLTVNILRELKDHPNISGIKVGGYNLTEITHAMMLRSSQFEVIGAGGGQLFQLLCLGAKAHTTSEGCCYPEPFLDVFSLFEQGKLEEARTLQFKIIELANKLPRTENGEYAAEEKYILAKRGICQEHVVPAFRKLTSKEKQITDRALKEFGFQWA